MSGHVRAEEAGRRVAVERHVAHHRAELALESAAWKSMLASSPTLVRASATQSAAGPGTDTLNSLWSLRPPAVHTAPADAQSNVAARVRITAPCADGLTVSAHQNERL